MGLFGKKKKAAQEGPADNAGQAPSGVGYQGQPYPPQAPAQQPGYPPQGPGQQQGDPSQWQQPAAAGAAGQEPAAPTAAPGWSDPIWQPIHGLSVDHYAQIVKYAHGQGIQDPYSIGQFAQQHYGIAPETWNAAAAGWAERMSQDIAVGQRFQQVYDAT